MICTFALKESEKATARRKRETPNCNPETIRLDISGVKDEEGESQYSVEGTSDSSSTVKEQQEQWIGEYELQEPQNKSVWVYKKADGEVER